MAGERELLAALSREFAEWFADEMDRMVPLIQRGLSAGLTPATAVTIAAAEIGIESATTNQILDSMVRAVSIGSGMASATVSGLGIRNTFLNDFWPGDEFSLSSRMASQGLQKRISSEIERHLAGSQRFNGAVSSWRETAEAILRVNGPRGEAIKGELSQKSRQLVKVARLAANGDAKSLASLQSRVGGMQKAIDRLSAGGAPNQALKLAYQDVLNSAKRLDVLGLDRAVKVAAKEKGQYYAERIARTEMARAYGTGFFTEALEDPDVIGVRWRLSSRHPEPDICDVNAKVDFYGMGPGVYPKGKTPRYPAHPHCLCALSQVFVGESDEGRFNPKAAERYLSSLPVGERKSMLGVEGARKPAKWRENLRGWSEHARPKVYPEVSRSLQSARARNSV